MIIPCSKIGKAGPEAIPGKEFAFESRFFGTVKIPKKPIKRNAIFQIICFAFQFPEHYRVWCDTAPYLHGFFVGGMMSHRHVWVVAL